MHAQMHADMHLLHAAAQWDVDGDGQLSEEEIRRGVDLRFAELDADGNGRVSADELASYLERQSAVSGKLLSHLMTMADQDADGQINPAELTRMAKLACGAGQLFA